jgi:hypothetical protein
VPHRLPREQETGFLARSVPVVLLVIAASAIVAIGATGVGLLLPRANLNGGWVLAVRIAGTAALAAGVAGLIVQRRQLRSNEDRRPDPTAAALVVAATIMAVLAVVARLAPAARIVNDISQEASTAAADSLEVNNEASAAGSSRSSGPGIGGLGLGLVREGSERRVAQRDVVEGNRSILREVGRIFPLVLLIVMVAIGVLALRGRMGRGRRELPPDIPVVAADAEAGLEASLGEVAYEGDDPRGQITAAYHRLLAALAAAGAPRKPQEAPHEHLHRALGPLGVQPEPMHRLTELYVVAQFGERPVTERHRAAAAEALEACLVSLRATV